MQIDPRIGPLMREVIELRKEVDRLKQMAHTHPVQPIVKFALGVSHAPTVDEPETMLKED